MITYTYTWDSAPQSVIIRAKTSTEAYRKVALYVLKKYKHNMSLQDMIGDLQEEGTLAEVQATIP